LHVFVCVALTRGVGCGPSPSPCLPVSLVFLVTDSLTDGRARTDRYIDPIVSVCEAMDSTLRMRHMAPTAPDTLSTVPLFDKVCLSVRARCNVAMLTVLAAGVGVVAIRLLLQLLLLQLLILLCLSLPRWCCSHCGASVERTSRTHSCWMPRPTFMLAATSARTRRVSSKVRHMCLRRAVESSVLVH
jgi:hypothetical protein